MWAILLCAAIHAQTTGAKRMLIVDVRDGLTAAPLPDTKIRIEGVGRANSVAFTELAGADGQAVFAELTPGRYRVQSERKGYADSSTGAFEELKLEAQDAPARFTLKLMPNASLEGRILDE